MIFGNNTFIRIIFISFGFFLLAINIVFWTNSSAFQFGMTSQEYWGAAYDAHDDFIGFGKLFSYLETFPGINFTIKAFNVWGNIIANYDVTGNGLLDLLLAIFRVISVPLALVVTIAGDIISNVMWFWYLITGNF